MKHTILFLAANPSGTDPRALDREARAIQAELKRSGFRDRFELVTRWASEPLDLLRELRELKPTVVHFSGHGSEPRRDVDGEPDHNGSEPRHGLFFQGPDGRPQLVSTAALEETFDAAGASVNLVVLSACYSEVQAKALLPHVGCVVGMSGAIRDDAARNFAIGFYGGLGERESIAAAYKQGCAAISLEGLRDRDLPQLAVRADVDVSKLILAADPAAGPAQTPALTPTTASGSRFSPAPHEPSRSHRRRWVSALGVVVSTLAVALIGYHMRPSQVEPGPRIATKGPPDPLIDSGHFHTSDSPVDAGDLDAVGMTKVAYSPDAAALDAARGGEIVSPSDARKPPEIPPINKTPSRACPGGMIAVPAGTFRMGSPRHVGNWNEQPEHEVTLSGYCIDRTEVTVKAYAACAEAGGCTAPMLTVSEAYAFRDALKRHDPRNDQLCNRNNRPDHPINCVDWNQAAAYCTWAGKRLPTEAEWEYAARGSDGRRYPWGNERPKATRLNACGVECSDMIMRVLDKPASPMYDASDQWESTAPVGSFPRNASPFGVLDMAGNVSEWIADWTGDYSADPAMNPHGPETGEARVVRGGDWNDFGERLVAASARNYSAPSFRSHNIGFRCASGRR